METVAEVTKTGTKIRPDITKMVKGAGGGFHKADFIGDTLSGLTVAQVLEIASDHGIDVSKYEHLNKGQQRMTVGNALRKIAASEEVQEAIAVAAADYKEHNESVAAELAAAKAAAKAEKAATAKPKKAKAVKVEDDADATV